MGGFEEQDAYGTTISVSKVVLNITVMHVHQELEGYYLGMPRVDDGSSLLAEPSATQPMHVIGTPKRGGRRTSMRNQPRANASAHAEALAAPRSIMLILEDFDEIRAFLARHFAPPGYDVYSSSTLRDALAIAWEESPQVILIDYNLRGDTALHAIKRLHEAQPKSCVVVVGGPQTPEIEEGAILAGATKVLSKAYGIAEMDQIVESAVNLHLSKPPYLWTS